MKVPGLRSLEAKSPLWPFAGCVGIRMGVILTSGQTPWGVFGGMSRVSVGRARRAARCSGVMVGEYDGATRYGMASQFFGTASEIRDML